jgi:PPM family protein phosphatase
MSPRSKARSDVGLKRQNNEDAFLTDDSIGLYAVADGMGGHAAGEVASNLALKAAAAAARQGVRAGVEDPLQLARMAGRSAVRAVFQEAESHPELNGMGTTLTLVVLRPESGALAHVGDSRAYRLRSGSVERLSTDHTIAAELVRLGFGDEESARRSPFGHNLSRSVGRRLDVEIELRAIDHQPDDRYLLCTDGLTDYVRRDEELVDDLMADFDQIPDGLVDFANEAGGHDNITVVVVELPDESSPAAIPISGLLAVTIDRP